jgi:hypothetical protein
VNLGYSTVEVYILLAACLPIFVQMLLSNVECGVGPLSVMSTHRVLFACVHVLKCLRKCLEFD